METKRTRQSNLSVGKVSNPASKFIEWNSTAKAFRYYDKSKGQNVEIKLPLEFIYLDDFNTIKGWSKKREAGLVSNEVKYLSKEPLRFGYFKDGKIEIIKEGFYKDIQPFIAFENGKFTKSIYALLPNGELVNFQLNGAGLGNWFDFYKANKNNLLTHTVKVEKFVKGQSGTVEYYTPVFELGRKMTDEEVLLADKGFEQVDTYYRACKEKGTAQDDDDATKKEKIQANIDELKKAAEMGSKIENALNGGIEETDDDLPF